jgi:RHS repeat-associated protein
MMNNEGTSNKSKINAPKISLPGGGGNIKGMGETFQPNSFSGTGSFSIPINTSGARGLEPHISLDYNSGFGNGIFGLGFDLNLPKIYRKTDKGIPGYNDTDRFLFSTTDELIPEVVKKENGTYIKNEKQATIGNATWNITSYRPRIEGLFAEIEYLVNTDTGESYWKIVTGDNITSLYGRSEDARVADPDDPTHVFEWFIEKTWDAHGNKILYTYKREDGDGVQENIYEKNRTITAKRYIQCIKYGNYLYDDGNNGRKEQYAFEIIFDYGGYSLDNPDALPGRWDLRDDPFSSYRSGFEIRTLRLCKNILLYHHLDGEFENKPFLVRAIHLEYNENQVGSQLTGVREIGYRKDSSGKYETKRMPSIEFEYSPFNPEEHTFKPLTAGNDAAIPGYINSSQYMMIDLYGDGIPGFLHSNDTTTLYWQPQGNGTYGFPEPPGEFPVSRNMGNPENMLMDLDGNGRLDLVVKNPPCAGYYQVNHDRKWDQYRNFSSSPMDITSPFIEMVDMSGDGLNDIVIMQQGSVKYYPSLGKEGYGAVVEVKRENDVPFNTPGYENEVLTFADMFGDGLTHRLRIRDGLVECWPNLGYGRFGKKVIMGNAPRFDGNLDARRLFLVDADGSGTTDIAYVYNDRVEVFLNQSGNTFGKEPVTITLPRAYDDTSQVSFADVSGNGTSCLVLTNTHPEVSHLFCDLAGGVKPHLLTKINNNLGATTLIEYASSVKFYLEDRKTGNPWKTGLPFPVQVIEKTESIDHITGSKLVSTYKYHDGYFDPVEREFRGFGFVERWDTEHFLDFSRPGLHKEAAFEANDESLHVPPVYTKSWYHTGAYIEAGVISKQFEGEYYQGDTKAYLLLDSAFDPLIDYTDPETIRQAYVALKGHVIREEVYGLDGEPGKGKEGAPYTVVERNFRVRLDQPRDSQRFAVFYVYEQESIYYDYERNPLDPRFEHDLTLEVDQWGNVNRSCRIYYPRRANDSEYPALKTYPEQAQLKSTAMEAGFINVTEGFRLLGVPCESMVFEITGLDLEGKDYFTFEQAKAQVDDALKNRIPYDGTPEPGLKQARLLDWERYYYWNENQDAPLESGSITARALLHHVEDAEFTPELVTKVFGRRLTDAVIKQKGGYVLKDGYWWNPGLTQVYFKADKFYLPCETQDNLGGKTTLEYDLYLLVPVKVTQFITAEIQNTSTALIDYHTLQPYQLTDMNNNISQVMFDPLGMVIVSTLFGTENGKEVGGMSLYPVGKKGAEYTRRFTTQTGDPITLEDVLENPDYYLQGALSFFFYNLFAWKEQGQPAGYINLLNEKYYHNENALEKAGFQVLVDYSDGFGRELEKKMKADPGMAVLRDHGIKLIFAANGKPAQAHTEERWIVSGRTVYNNKGKPTLQYQPYFSSTPYYETQKEITDNDLVPPPVIIHYDPLLRVIKTETPKKKETDGSVTGFFSKVEFNSWMEKHYDEDDTVKDSSFYKKHIDDTDPGFKYEKQALEKAAVFYDTPGIKILDNMARAFCAIEVNLEQGSSEKIYLPTHTRLDIEGNPLEMTDPRLARLNPPVPNLTHVFDMSGDILYSKSVDAGTNLGLKNIFGEDLWNLSPMNYCQLTGYDALQRIESVRVKKITGDEPIEDYADFNLVEKYSYGETVARAEDYNLRGQVFRVKDLSGVVTNSQYSMQAQIQETSRQFALDYKDAIDWNQEVGLEQESYLTQFSYDALKRIISETTPDGSVCINSYNRTGQLFSVEVRHKDGTTQPVVEHIEYDANNHRTEIKYGNQVTTVYTYEDTTLRLTGIKSTGIREGQENPVIQDIEYTYDPVGNITHIIDNTYDTAFCNTQDVEPGLGYTYDALYCLIQATGRQHPGITAATYKNNAKDGDFKQSKFGYLCPANPEVQTHLEGYTEIYTYDDSGNLVNKEHSADSSSWSMATPVPDDSNRLKDQAYDESGNMKQVNINSPVDLSFNCCENLVKAGIITRPGEPDDCDYYNYDSNEIRTRKVSEHTAGNGSLIDKTVDIYLGNYSVKLVKKGSDGNEETILQRETLRVMDDRTCVAILDYWLKDDAKQEVPDAGTGKTRYQLDNHLGSVCLEVDFEGKLTSYEEYFPYGGTAIIAGNSQDEVRLKDYRYSGKERDDSTGFYYYGARYYAPWLGRWLKPDPAGIVDGLNLYAFVGGEPVTHVDIEGYFINNAFAQKAFRRTPGIWGRGAKQKRKLTDKQHLTLGYESFKSGETQGKRGEGGKGGLIYLFRVPDKPKIPSQKGQVFTTLGNPWTPQRSVAWVKGGISSNASFVLTTDPTDSGAFTQSRGSHKGELSILGREVSELLSHNYIPIFEKRSKVLKKSKKVKYEPDDYLIVMEPGRTEYTSLTEDWSRVSSEEVPVFKGDFFAGINKNVKAEDLSSEFHSFVGFVAEESQFKLYGNPYGRKRRHSEIESVNI